MTGWEFNPSSLNPESEFFIKHYQKLIHEIFQEAGCIYPKYSKTWRYMTVFYLNWMKKWMQKFGQQIDIIGRYQLSTAFNFLNTDVCADWDVFSLSYKTPLKIA